MNAFDQRIDARWRAEKEGADFATYSRIISDVMAELYKEKAPEEADELIFRSGNLAHVSIGTAMGIQRRIVLRLMDRLFLTEPDHPVL